MKQDHYRKLLLSSECPRILVAGDIILDRFIRGSVTRISPEAPVQVVNVNGESIALGGAANVAHNLAAIGTRVTLAGVIGDDEHGRTVIQEMKQLGIDAGMILTDSRRPTSVKTRVLAGHQQVVRIDREDSSFIPPDTEQRLLSLIEASAASFDLMVLSDYLKGVLTDTVTKRLIRIAQDHDKIIIIDPKRADLSVYAGATLIKPNLKEAEQSVRRKISTAEDAIQAGKELAAQYHFRNVLITRGAEGMTLVTDGGCQHFPATAREVFDVTGAGDTVTAYLARILACGAPVSDAVYLANRAAGVAVSKVGTVSVTREEVLHDLEEVSSGASKIVTAAELSVILPALRKNKTVVFTNGCFDILHVGHITLLTKSRALGDMLIVGLNSDASIRRIKGEKRPIVSEQERAHILAALESVDYVVLFDEDTPIELIKKVRPDILVKGSDYKPEQVVGKDIVESYGGRIQLVDLVAGFSTTNIVEAILKNYSE